MSKLAHHRPDAVVATGAGVVCAIGSDVRSFAGALKEGRSGIAARGETPSGAPRISAELCDFDFAAVLAARDALPKEWLARARRVAMRAPFPVQAAVAAALEAAESGGLKHAPVSPERLGLIVAGSNLTGGYAESLRASFARNPAYLRASFARHCQDIDHLGTLSEILSIAGEGFTVGGASASGNVGIINAARLVSSGAVDACLAVGALTELSAMEWQGFVNVGAMLADHVADPARACRPFDRARKGFVYGQGAACLLLETEASALRRGVPLLAGIGGYAMGLDCNSGADPSVEGEARAMTAALRMAGLEAGHVAYVNTHGTASRLGDEVEIAAIRTAFGDSFQRPWINATKALTGHCLNAAGIIEVVATICQMHGGFVHPNVSLTDPIDSEAKFVGAAAVPAEIEFALSNSFGFAGINSSVLLVNRKT